jgi:hypothetical protein
MLIYLFYFVLLGIFFSLKRHINSKGIYVLTSVTQHSLGGESLRLRLPLSLSLDRDLERLRCRSGRVYFRKCQYHSTIPRTMSLPSRRSCVSFRRSRSASSWRAMPSPLGSRARSTSSCG